MAWDGCVNFTAPPEIGATIETPDGILTLWKVEPYTRKRDGAASFVLHWSASSETRFTSGLAGKLTKQKEA